MNRLAPSSRRRRSCGKPLGSCAVSTHMTSTAGNTRVAGLLYLLLSLAAPLRLIYIPGKLIVRGNAAATANNIAAHETLFRLGIVSDLFCGVILIFLVLALYRLFKDVDQKLA